MDSKSSYVDWLNQYTERIEQMDPIERKAERREDYRHSSQVYPDYLDYIEEWESLAYEKVNEIHSSLIFNMGNFHLRMQCKCGVTHHFCKFNNKQNIPEHYTVVDDPRQVTYNQCWYVYTREQVKKTIQNLREGNRRLPDPVENLLSTIVQIKMVELDQTGFVLPFEAWKKLWFDLDNKGSITKESKQVNATLTHEAKTNIQFAKLGLLPTVDRKEVLLHFPHSDHGLHSLRKNLRDQVFTEILNFMNRKRKELGFRAKITLKDILEKEEQCEHCCDEYVTGLPPQAIYYAPPGCGKTTVLNKELLVAFDTDWIGVGLNWRDYSPLLSRGISIITNQSHIFIGCGLKIIGCAKKSIRRQLTTLEHVKEFARSQSRNMILLVIPDSKFLADYITKLQILALISNTISASVLSEQPFYKNNNEPHWIRRFAQLRRNAKTTQVSKQKVAFDAKIVPEQQEDNAIIKIPIESEDYQNLNYGYADEF